VPNLEVVHQSGAGREETVLSAYRRFGMKSVRVDPFFHDIAGELSRADLVVARAGAGTVAEIAAKARPALLIPFPEAADDHQTKNAQALVEAGGAICLPQSVALVPRLARDLSALLNDPARLTRMSRASRAFGQPNAARDIARDLASLGGIDWTDEASRPDKANGALHTEVP
jgi:UDP-N-acetylglucosamine--N-acetylmuramyl-(pentapeptide) pyrophosphoryl-undecaprenol N-acetylglucosamine transferase